MEPFRAMLEMQHQIKNTVSWKESKHTFEFLRKHEENDTFNQKLFYWSKIFCCNYFLLCPLVIIFAIFLWNEHGFVLFIIIATFLMSFVVTLIMYASTQLPRVFSFSKLGLVLQPGENQTIIKFNEISNISFSEANEDKKTKYFIRMILVNNKVRVFGIPDNSYKKRITQFLIDNDQGDLIV